MDFKVPLGKHIVCLIVMVCKLVPILTTKANLSLQTKLVYDCLTNGSINVINPEPETLTEAHAHGNGKLCDVIFSYGFSRFIITDCEGLEPIYIKLYDPGGDGIIIDNLSCKRSPPDQGSNVDRRSSVDVAKTKSVQTGIQIQLPNGITIDKSPPTVNDTEMVLKDESGQIVNRHVYVGEALIWEIAIPTKRRYTLIPVTCNATTDGTSLHFSSPAFTFIEKGLNKDLATHFYVQRDGYTRSWATLFAFRFRFSPLVIINCALHICQEWDQKCNYNCASIKRSSKDIGKFILHEPEEFVVSMHMRVIEGYSQYEINRGSKAMLPFVFWYLLLTTFWTIVQ